MSQHTSSSQLTCVDRGHGPVVVLVHGFPLDHRMWEAQIDALATTHRVIAPDLCGFGDSALPAGKTTMDCYAKAIDALLTAKGVKEPVQLAGFSMGGYVAFAFLRLYASRVGSLMLVDTKAAPDSAEAAQGRASLAQKVLTQGSAVAAEALVPKLLCEATMKGNAKLVSRVRQMIEDQDPASIAAALDAMAHRPDSGPGLAVIRIPTLLIVGEHDVITPPAEMKKVASCIAESKLVEIKDAGHLTTMEQPAAVNKAIKAFLDCV